MNKVDLKKIKLSLEYLEDVLLEGNMKSETTEQLVEAVRCIEIALDIEGGR